MVPEALVPRLGSHDALAALPGEAIGGAVGRVGVAKAARLEGPTHGTEVRQQEGVFGAVRGAPGPEELRPQRQVQSGQHEHDDEAAPRPALAQRPPRPPKRPGGRRAE